MRSGVAVQKKISLGEITTGRTHIRVYFRSQISLWDESIKFELFSELELWSLESLGVVVVFRVVAVIGVVVVFGVVDNLRYTAVFGVVTVIEIVAVIGVVVVVKDIRVVAVIGVVVVFGVVAVIGVVAIIVMSRSIDLREDMSRSIDF